MDVDTIREVKFEKTAVFGYKPEDVDEFLAETAKELELLIEEKEDLENKLAVLADTIENYREQEESLKTTLLAAQKLSDQIIRDARIKADSIIADAEKRRDEIDKETEKKKADIQKEIEKSIERERKMLSRLQGEVSSFKSNLLELYKRHLDMIAVIPEFSDEDNAAKPTDTAVPEEGKGKVLQSETNTENDAEKNMLKSNSETVTEENVNGLLFNYDENN